MHPKVRMFLAERDRAYARGDAGVIRSMNAELRRLNISDEATLTNPHGKNVRKRIHEASAKPVGRPKLPRCEHGSVAERCPECNEEVLAS